MTGDFNWPHLSASVATLPGPLTGIILKLSFGCICFFILILQFFFENYSLIRLVCRIHSISICYFLAYKTWIWNTFLGTFRIGKQLLPNKIAKSVRCKKVMPIWSIQIFERLFQGFLSIFFRYRVSFWYHYQKDLIK